MPPQFPFTGFPLDTESIHRSLYWYSEQALRLSVAIWEHAILFFFPLIKPETDTFAYVFPGTVHHMRTLNWHSYTGIPTLRLVLRNCLCPSLTMTFSRRCFTWIRWPLTRRRRLLSPEDNFQRSHTQTAKLSASRHFRKQETSPFSARKAKLCQLTELRNLKDCKNIPNFKLKWFQ